MSLHRRAAKRDAVEAEIVELLRKFGWSVERLSLADGPDLLLGYNGHTFLAEVKTGRKKLRPGQADWHARWRGSQVFVMRDVKTAEALALMAGARGMGLFRGKQP